MSRVSLVLRLIYTVHNFLRLHNHPGLDAEKALELILEDEAAVWSDTEKSKLYECLSRYFNARS